MTSEVSGPRIGSRCDERSPDCRSANESSSSSPSPNHDPAFSAERVNRDYLKCGLVAYLNETERSTRGVDFLPVVRSSSLGSAQHRRDESSTTTTGIGMSHLSVYFKYTGGCLLVLLFAAAKLPFRHSWNAVIGNHAAASIIPRRAVSSGRDSIERWLDFTSIVVALIFFAIVLSRSG